MAARRLCRCAPWGGSGYDPGAARRGDGVIELSFPTAASRSFEPGVTGRAVAASIAPSLAKRAVLVKLDGELRDLERPLEQAAGSSS
jgi:hypothetical protein